MKDWEVTTIECSREAVVLSRSMHLSFVQRWPPQKPRLFSSFLEEENNSWRGRQCQATVDLWHTSFYSSVGLVSFIFQIHAVDRNINEEKCKMDSMPFFDCAWISIVPLIEMWPFSIGMIFSYSCTVISTSESIELLVHIWCIFSLINRRGRFQQKAAQQVMYIEQLHAHKASF